VEAEFDKWRVRYVILRKTTGWIDKFLGGKVKDIMAVAVGALGHTLTEGEKWVTLAEPMFQRRFARTKGGFLVLMPSGASLRDKVVLLREGRVPLMAP
jgi:hypothetical protein